MRPQQAQGDTAARSAAPVEPADCALLIQLHVAEYSALTMRNTYWITLEYTLWTILILFLGVVGQFYSSLRPELAAWGIVSVGGILMVCYYAALYEQYNNVRYIERRLRPAVQQIVSHVFWEYETDLATRRGLNPGWWELLPAIGLLASIIVASVVRLPTWWCGDWVALAGTLALAIMTARQARSVIELRKEFSPPPVGDRTHSAT